MMSLYNLIHVVAALVWVGGMFFAYNCLRPAAGELLEPPDRLRLWAGVFKRFFPFVWLSVILLPLTGYMMVFTVWASLGQAPVYVHIMNGLGIAMILIYMYVFFAPYQRLTKAVADQRWSDGGKALAQIRLLVAVNTILGVLVVIVASGGRLLG